MDRAGADLHARPAAPSQGADAADFSPASHGALARNPRACLIPATPGWVTTLRDCPLLCRAEVGAEGWGESWCGTTHHDTMPAYVQTRLACPAPALRFPAAADHVQKPERNA